MLLAFATFLVFTFAFLWWRKVFRRRVWMVVVVLAFVLSLFLAYVSVSSVWTPHPLSSDVFPERNAPSEYEGVFPWSRLSYPLYLNVYHTPFDQLTWVYPLAYGQVRFSMFFASAKILVVNGTFSYLAYAMGPMPLSYNIDFLFSHSRDFFYFLLAMVTFFNIIGSLLGIILAKTLHKTISK